MDATALRCIFERHGGKIGMGEVGPEDVLEIQERGGMGKCTDVGGVQKRGKKEMLLCCGYRCHRWRRGLMR